MQHHHPSSHLLLLLGGSSEKLLISHQSTTFSSLATGRTLDPSLQKSLTRDHLEPEKVLRHSQMLQHCIKVLPYQNIG